MMKTYIAITLFDGSDDMAGELLDALNRILMSPLAKSVYIYDVSKNGAGKEIRSFVKAYNKYGVFMNRIKRAGKLEHENQRYNLGMAESLLHFNHIKSKTYDTFIHCSQNMLFSAHDLGLLVNNARLYHAVSPIIETTNGLEIWNAVFDRYGVTYSKGSESPSFFITGAIEESYTLNPKCFGMSNQYARKMKNFTISERDPVDYINGLLYGNTDQLPVLDTGLFVHENLY